MRQTVANPSPASASKPGSRRRSWLSPKPETRSIQIGILGTILIHLLLLLLAPRLLRTESISSIVRPHARPNQFNIEIQPDLFTPPKPPAKPPMKFVEANPNAPENTPDKTNNFSDRNQQVAQEKPTPNGKSDMPALTGRKDIQSTQIVTGQLTKPEESAPVAPAVATPPRPPSVAAPRAAQDPLSGFEKKQSPDLDAFGSNIAKPSDTAKPIPDKIDGVKNAPLVENSTSSIPQIDPKHPQPRKTIDQHVRPAIFTDNPNGTANSGITALDSRWSNYGVYLKRLTETVQVEWDNILTASMISPRSGSTVSITFVLNSKGQISKIVKVDSSPGTLDTATSACVSGLTNRAPYGDWTDDMIALLGTEQQMTFTFLYE